MTESQTEIDDVPVFEELIIKSKVDELSQPSTVWNINVAVLLDAV